jgi:hypothetical protein
MPAKKMVEVFATNVQEAATDFLTGLLLEHFPGSRINFDIEDCDRILRVEGHHVFAEKVIGILGASGYECRVLD